LRTDYLKYNLHAYDCLYWHQKCLQNWPKEIFSVRWSQEEASGLSIDHEFWGSIDIGIAGNLWSLRLWMTHGFHRIFCFLWFKRIGNFTFYVFIKIKKHFQIDSPWLNNNWIIFVVYFINNHKDRYIPVPSYMKILFQYFGYKYMKLMLMDKSIFITLINQRSLKLVLTS
jgi:hypothetical protein